MSPRPKYVCECLKVTEAAVLRAIKAEKIVEMKALIDRTSAGEGCTACHPLLQEYLERIGGCAAAKSEAATCLPTPSARTDSSPSLSL